VQVPVGLALDTGCDVESGWAGRFWARLKRVHSWAYEGSVCRRHSVRWPVGQAGWAVLWRADPREKEGREGSSRLHFFSTQMVGLVRHVWWGLQRGPSDLETKSEIGMERTAGSRVWYDEVKHALHGHSELVQRIMARTYRKAEITSGW